MQYSSRHRDTASKQGGKRELTAVAHTQAHIHTNQ